MLFFLDFLLSIICFKYYALFLDIDPPVFTFCPESIKVSTVKDTEIVHWSNPKAKDNVGVVKINGSHTPGSSFSPGMNVVNYTATDQAGNQAYCSFTVIVSDSKFLTFDP